MNPNLVVILHGWNDTSASFQPLAAWLQGQGFRIIPIYLADYLTLHDEITIHDLGSAFSNALSANHIPKAPHAFDCIVHSTGGLVVREYLRQVCEGNPQDTPIQNLLMYSPANFGSPLAAMGKSVLGRMLDGWHPDALLQTGTAILNALELASPYSWDLGIADRLSPSTNDIFAPQNTLVTIVTGTAAYPLPASLLHENGSDGTVRVSTASLNVAMVKIDCNNIDPAAIPSVEFPGSRIALAVLNRDHSDTHNPSDKLPDFDDWKRLTLAALTGNPSEYQALSKTCSEVAAATFAQGLTSNTPLRYHQYQSIVVFVHDQFGNGIPDYVVEFYQENGDDQDHVFTTIHGDILVKVTTNSTDASYRSFLIDFDALNGFLAANPTAQIEFSVSAAPVSSNITYNNPSRGIPIFTGAGAALLLPNSPLLIDVTLYRVSSSDVFELAAVAQPPGPAAAP
jgi:hypothetical protein